MKRNHFNFLQCLSKTAVACGYCSYTLLAQITVNINSGNPAFPFPQFQPYVNPTDTLGNLGTKNSAGVPHAEMEQTIRDAYQIMMNRANKTGTSLHGIAYIKYASIPDCTEGDGYAMLAAAAMADKTTFDGLWLWIHDNAMNKVTGYSTGKVSPAYHYSALPGWQNAAGGNSAADADADMALALFMAYRQWGEFMGINDSMDNPISYKHDCIEFLKGLTDTIPFVPNSGATYISGDIGLDGYIKSGDSWTELTNWASDTIQSGLKKPPQLAGPAQQYIDYAAPAYFHEFADFLSQENASLYAWNIKQFQRCEASSDWIMGQLLTNQNMIPSAGHVSVSSGNEVTFTQFNEGEDFRLAWRTILNRVWNGNPASSWNPETHQIQAGAANTYEFEIGKRFARFLWDARQAPWNNSCVPVAGSSASTYWGPSVLYNSYDVLGKPLGTFFLNWIQGTGSPSAIVAQDFKLMSEMYRQCEIEFNVENPGDGYLTSVPKYFQDWFRLLGLLVLSGNYSAPMNMQPAANMKVYLDVDKTCACKDDTITYTITYRNYGSLDAHNVSIVATLSPDFSIISATGNPQLDAAPNLAIWKINSVSGFKTSTGVGPTTGEFTLKAVSAHPTKQQYANHVEIFSDNVSNWVANEYPNCVSATMKRNYVDIRDPPRTGGDSLSEVSSLHGGRPGVDFSCSFNGGANAANRIVRIRIFHDAQESYINFGNYRVSYFLFDTLNSGLANQGNPNGWQITTYVREGFDSLVVLHEKLASGSNGHGKWNQRIIFQFSNTSQPNDNWSVLTTTNRHLDYYYGNASKCVHRGRTVPFRFICSINTASWQNVQWEDDWSWNPQATLGSDASSGFPITPDLTDPTHGNPGVPVDRLNPKHCEIADTTVSTILVEEWDGSVWRRVFGNAPMYSVSTFQSSASFEKHLSMQSVNQSRISYVLPRQGHVRLHILDLKGRIVASLVDAFQAAGTYSLKLDNCRLGSNVHFLRLLSEKESLVQKIISLR